MPTEPVAERDAEASHLEELRNILRHRERLYVLQRAKTAPNTDPDVLIGLAETQQELRLVEAKRQALRISPEVLQAVGVEGLFLEISAKIDNLASSQQTLNERVDATAARVDVIEEATTAGAAWRDAETLLRLHGQRRRFWIDAGMMATLLLIAGILLYVFR